MEEQGRIQAREHPIRTFTNYNHSPLLTYIQLLLTSVFHVYNTYRCKYVCRHVCLYVSFIQTYIHAYGTYIQIDR